MNEAWPLEIESKVLRHFETNKGSYYCYFSGMFDERAKHKARFEVRLLGPKFKETSKDIYQVHLDVDILCEITPETGTTRDPLAASKISSYVASKMVCINTDLGVLEPSAPQMGPVITLADQPFLRRAVRCSYTMTIM